MPSFALTCLLFAGVALSQNATYDYVIAGAGTAGMFPPVVPTQNPNTRVAVLPAGADGRAEHNITNPQHRGK